MPTYRFQVVMPYFTLLPQDVSVNVFHATCDTPADAEAFAQDVVNFYTITSTGAGQDSSLGSRFASVIARGTDACRVEVYDLGDPEPRVPFHTLQFTLNPPAAGSNDLPYEVATCLSFQAGPSSGTPQARRRGRVFLGPLNDVVLAHDDLLPVPDATWMDDMVISAEVKLLDSANGFWGVYSRVNAGIATVQNGWVDNEFDTQRRRQLRATSRTVFPV